jgi:hypothetical protein
MFLQLLHINIKYCTTYVFKYFKKCEIFKVCKNVENVKGLIYHLIEQHNRWFQIFYVTHNIHMNSLPSFSGFFNIRLFVKIFIRINVDNTSRNLCKILNTKTTLVKQSIQHIFVFILNPFHHTSWV